MNILKRPMFYSAAFCSIAAATSLFSIKFAVIFLVISTVIFAVISIDEKRNYILAVIAICLFAANLWVQFNKIEEINNINGEIVLGDFLVTADIVEYDDFNTVELKVIKSDNLPRNVKILIFDHEKTKLSTGDIVYANLKISAIDKSDKYRLSNYSDGIYATANINDIKNIGIDKFYKFTKNIRNYVNNTITKNLSGDTAGLLCAITTGDKTLLSDDFSHNVKTTGISHVVVVSGMHLSIIMIAVLFVIDRLFYNKYLRCILSLSVIITIMAICGFTMSVIRAGTTFIIASLAPVFNRENDSLNSLLCAVTIILAIDPFAVFNISFLLSALSTLAIIWVVPFYSNLLFSWFKIKSNGIKTVIQMILCCLFANVFTLPVSIKIFGYMSVVSPITNIAITYFVTFALILNIIAVCLYAVPYINFIGEFFITTAGKCAQIIVFIVNKIASLPITVAVLPKSAFWFSICIIVLIIAFMYLFNLRSKNKEVI